MPSRSATIAAYEVLLARGDLREPQEVQRGQHGRRVHEPCRLFQSARRDGESSRWSTSREGIISTSAASPTVMYGRFAIRAELRPVEEVVEPDSCEVQHP